MQEYKNIRAIYPPTNGTIPKACYSCGGDVKLDCGFADMTKPPFKGYLCQACTVVAIGGNKAAELLQDSQDKARSMK